LEIRIAYKDESPAAAILTLRFKNVLYYKYGCSDARLNKLGATPWLIWRAISAAKLSGASEFDMGRTEEGNAGLLAFKNHWVPAPKQLVYWSYPEVSGLRSGEGWKVKMAKRVFSIMPRRLMALTGSLIYRHIG
ncbi:MAG: GNAT family N-acetyltransferase, partial [Candidatus Acidiferrales bacterium]